MTNANNHLSLLAKCPPEVAIELEQYVLECNFPKLERVAHRQYKQKNISHESDFQSRYLLTAFETPINAMDLPKFSQHTLDKAIHECRKAIDSSTLYSSEQLFLMCMLGKLLVFVGRYDEAMLDAFGRIDQEELVNIFRNDHPDSEECLKTVAGSLPILIAIQACFCWGVAAEQTGRAVEAFLPYSYVTDYARHLPSGHHLLRSKAALFFTGMSMFRYGMLCSTLSIDPRPLLRASQSSRSRSNLAIGQLRSKLLFDAAISLRMFISFQPNIFGVARHIAAWEAYLMALEGRFRKSNYQSAFEVEHQFYGLLGNMGATTGTGTGAGGSLASDVTANILALPASILNVPPVVAGAGSSILSSSSATTATPFAPENMEEDLLFGMQVLQTLIINRSLKATVPSSNTISSIAEEVQRGASLPLNLGTLGRLARLGDTEGLVSFAKGMLTRYAGGASVYGRLALSCATSLTHLDEVLRAGEIYFSLGGREAAVMAVVASRALLLRGWSQKTIPMLEEMLQVPDDASKIDEAQRNTLRILLGLALIKSSIYEREQDKAQQTLEAAITKLAEAVVYDETDPRTHLTLALGYAIQGKLKSAEDSVKTSLSLESEQPAAWYLFALLASSRKDYDLCWQICNSFGLPRGRSGEDSSDEWENPSNFGIIPIALLKAELLIYLGLVGDAISLVGNLISTFTQPAGMVIEDFSSSFSALKLGETVSDEKSNPDPAHFRSRFYPPQEQSLSHVEPVIEVSPAQKYKLTISEYKEAFPDSAARTAVARLRGKTNDELFPETTICSHEYLAMLETESISEAKSNPLLTSRLWCTLGRIYLVQENIPYAEICAHEAILTSELNSDTYRLKGEILERQGNRAEAIDAYRLALQMNPMDTEAHLGLACCLYDEPVDTVNCYLALQSAQQAVDADPRNVSALGMAAEISRHLDMNHDAATFYQQALHLENTAALLPWHTALHLTIHSLIR